MSKKGREYHTMTNKITCEQCCNSYDNVGVHWSRSDKCDHPKITDYQKEVISGIVMGDGHVECRDGKNPCVRIAMTNKEYLNYLSGNVFPVLSNGASLKRKCRRAGVKDIYSVRIMSHPELSEFAEWYSSGKKVFPEGIKLTKTLLKNWYCCDGHRIKRSSRDSLEIAMTNEKGNGGKIESMFDTAGFSISNFNTTGNRFHARFTVNESEEIWEYMGDPLPGFEYKWPDNWEK